MAIKIEAATRFEEITSVEVAAITVNSHVKSAEAFKIMGKNPDYTNKRKGSRAFKWQISSDKTAKMMSNRLKAAGIDHIHHVPKHGWDRPHITIHTPHDFDYTKHKYPVTRTKSLSPRLRIKQPKPNIPSKAQVLKDAVGRMSSHMAYHGHKLPQEHLDKIHDILKQHSRKM